MVESHMNDMFGNDLHQAILQSMNEKISSELLRTYLCNHAWVSKGRLQNIHFNFGLHSYTCGGEIDSRYHFSQEDRVNLLLELSSKLADLDKI